MKVVPSAVRDATALMLNVPGKTPAEVFEAASWVVLVTVVKLIGPKNFTHRRARHAVFVANPPT